MDPNEPEQINDLNSPRKPQHTSKPIIVGHRPMMPDPMVNRPENPEAMHPKPEASKDAPAIFEPPQPTPQPAQPALATPKPPAPPTPLPLEPKREFTPPPPMAQAEQNRQPAASRIPVEPMEVHIPSGKAKQKTTKRIVEVAIILALIAVAFYAGQSL